MIWFFERGAEVTRIHTTLDNDTQEYVLVIEPPNEGLRSERYREQLAYHARLAELEEQLRADDWVPRGHVQLTEYGWRGPTTRPH